jgi:hypothetical protein
MNRWDGWDAIRSSSWLRHSCQIANRLDDLAAELLASAAYQWASLPAHMRDELHARVQRSVRTAKEPATLL